MSSLARPYPDVAALLRRIYALRHLPTQRASPHFFLEGVRHFVQACDAEWPIEAIVCSPKLVPSSLVEMLIRRLKRAGVPEYRVSPEEFRRLSTADRASGIGALVGKRWTPLAELEPRRGLCFLAIEELRSAGNLGTILRTAEACGVGGVIFVGDERGCGVSPATKCDPFDPVVMRAGMGGVFHLQLVRTTQAELAAWRTARGVRCVGLSPGAASLWTAMPRDEPLCLMVGEERQGLSPAMAALCDVHVRLPMTGRADSLNVGVAVGVTLYELVRRTCE